MISHSSSPFYGLIFFQSMVNRRVQCNEYVTGNGNPIPHLNDTDPVAHTVPRSRGLSPRQYSGRYAMLNTELYIL